jgi:hypothetical protein
LPLVLLPLLRIKEAVDHAGHFPLPDLWKVPTSWLETLLLLCLNSNSLIAIEDLH